MRQVSFILLINISRDHGYPIQYMKKHGIRTSVCMFIQGDGSAKLSSCNKGWEPLNQNCDQHCHSNTCKVSLFILLVNNGKSFSPHYAMVCCCYCIYGYMCEWVNWLEIHDRWKITIISFFLFSPPCTLCGAGL